MLEEPRANFIYNLVGYFFSMAHEQDIEGKYSIKEFVNKTISNLLIDLNYAEMTNNEKDYFDKAWDWSEKVEVILKERKIL